MTSTLFSTLLDEQEHALYDVHRILRPRKTDLTKLGNAARSVRIRGRGTRDSMQGILDGLAAAGGPRGLVRAITGDDGITRVYQHERGPRFPGSTHLVVAGAVRPRAVSVIEKGPAPL